MTDIYEHEKPYALTLTYQVTPAPSNLTAPYDLHGTYDAEAGGGSQAVNVGGFDSLAFGLTSAINHQQFVSATGWEATQHSTHDIKNKNQFVFAGLGGSSLAFGDSEIFNRNTYTTVTGIQLAQYGTTRVEHYRRGLLIGGVDHAAVETPLIRNANRTISPLGINTNHPSNHLIGGTRYILAEGFSATTFGTRIIPEIQTVYPSGMTGAFGEVVIANRRKVITTIGFSTGGAQPADRWGSAKAYNKRQYINMYFDGDSELNPPAWPIWTKIANRNRVIATFGKKETIFAEPIVANNARVLVAQGISAQDAPPFYKSGMVSHRIRTIPMIGIESFSSSMWGVVYNNARLVKPIGKDCALFGVAKAVKTRRYFDHIGGFDSSVFGTSMTSHRVRTITLDSRYAIAPPSIKLPEVKLFTRYIDGIGADVSRLGSPSLTIHFNRITPRWTMRDRYGLPTLRNVTPQVRAYGHNSEEHGTAQVRLQWRPVHAFGENSQGFGRSEVAYRDRTRFITGFNAGFVSDKLKVIQSGAPPYSTQTIYASSIDAPSSGVHTVNQRVIYVPSILTSINFGEVSVAANTIRVEPGYQELLVGNPSVSLRNRIILVAASKDPPEPSIPRISPHTLMVLSVEMEEKPFGTAYVTLQNRRVFAHSLLGTRIGNPELKLKRQYIEPNGIKSYRFGWHSIPGIQLIEQYESVDFSEMGYNQLSRPPHSGPQEINPFGLLSYQSEPPIAELKNRTIIPNGHDSLIMGASISGDTPYMWQGLRIGPRVPIVANGTDMSSFGLTWISNRVRGLSTAGFDSFLCEYQLEAFDRRMKVTRRVIPVVPRQLAPVGIPAFVAGTPNVRAGVHYIRPDGNADQYRKGAF